MQCCGECQISQCYTESLCKINCGPWPVRVWAILWVITTQTDWTSARNNKMNQSVIAIEGSNAVQEGSDNEQDDTDPDSQLFGDTDHLRILRDEMRSSLQTGQFSDIEIKCQGRLFKLHRNILSMTCPYFKTMFTSSFKEGSQSQVTLHDVEASAFADVLEYLYSGELLVTKENVVAIAKLADMFELFALHEYCCKFLMDRIAHINCFGFMKFGRMLNSIKLEKASSRFALQHFNEVIKHEEFLELDHIDLCNYLRQPIVNATKEEDILKSCFRWLERKPSERIHNFKEVLCSIHILDIDFSVIRFSLMKIPALRNNVVMTNFLNDIQDHVLYKFQVPKEVEVLSPRLLTNTHKGILFFLEKVRPMASQSSQPANVVPFNIFVAHRDSVNLQKKNFSSVVETSNLTLPQGISCCAAGATTIYVSCLGAERNELYRVEVNIPRWQLCSTLAKGRLWHRLVSGSDSKLYVVGGEYFKGEGAAGEILEFNCGISSWSHVGDLAIPVKKCGAIFTKGDIIVVGGLSTKVTNGDYTTAVVTQCQRFDTLSKQCTVLAPHMPLASPVVKLFMPRGRIIVITEQKLLSFDLNDLYSSDDSQLDCRSVSHKLSDKFTGEILGKRLIIITKKGVLCTAKWQNLFENNGSVVHFELQGALCHDPEKVNCCEAALVSLRANNGAAANV